MNKSTMNLELKKNVNHFVKTRMKDIRFVDDIFEISMFSIENPNYNDDMKNLRRLKKILQITINVYNDFEDYKDYTFKFTRQDTDNVHPLDKFYHYDVLQAVWVCDYQPSEELVEDALFNYILCFKSIDFAEDSVDITNVDHCPFCDSIIQSDNQVCSTCEASVSDIKMYLRTINMKKKEKNTDIQNVKSKIEIDDHQYDSDCDADNNDTKINRVFVKGNREEVTKVKPNTSVVMNENRRKCAKCKDVYCMTEDDKLYHRGTWICRDCKRSENDGDNAGWIDLTKEVVSLSDHGVWSCDRCGSNSIDDNGECDNCRRIEDMKRGNIATVDTARWKCGSCKTMYPYNVQSCDTCQCTMVEGGLWLCESCTFENKFIDARCDVCFTENRHSLIRFCQICKEVKIGDSELFCGKCSVDNNHSKVDEGWWQCGFVDCGAWSNGSEDYCKNCGIWKDGFLLHNRGDLLKRMKHGASTAVWICTSCHRFNKFDTSTCGGWLCWAKRYEKKICDKCHKQNDGTSNYCKRCKVYL